MPTVLLASFVQGNESVEELDASRNLASVEMTATPAIPIDDLINADDLIDAGTDSSRMRKTVIKNNRVHSFSVQRRPYLRVQE